MALNESTDSEINVINLANREGKETEKVERLNRLPLARIKSLIKLDNDVNLTSQEAIFLLAKATELFLEHLARESYTFTLQNKKKTLQKKDIESAIDQIDNLVFLEGTLDD